MILSDEVIKDGLNYHNHWISLSREILTKSHLEANARIRILEAENQCLRMHLEDCRLEAEGVGVYIHEATNAENRADRLAVIADAIAIELEALKRWNKGADSFSLKSCPAEFSEAAGRLLYEDGDDEKLDLGEPTDISNFYIIKLSRWKQRADRAEAKLRELVEIVDAYFEGGLGPVDAMKQVTKIMDRREE